MTVVQTSVFGVMRKFPGHRVRIMKLFREREDFRCICEDYQKCLMSLRHWNASEAEEAAERREEYLALASDLESEIRESLGKEA